MKKDLRVLSGLALIVLLAMASAVAAAKPAVAVNRVVADIPFEFSVGYKTMPAGQYSVQALPNGNGLLIQSRDGKTSALRLSNTIESSKTQSHARLVFHRYGDRYFLAEVWDGSDKIGRELLRSAEERNMESELAKNTTDGEKAYETVVIAALR